MAYAPIENHGIVGDMKTIALSAMNGMIDWFCFPRFDSPSVFGAILDEQRGGFFRISPVEEQVTTKQFYWPDTNVLTTRFFCSDSVVDIVDYMPIGGFDGKQRKPELVRRVNMVRGNLELKLECYPAFDYGRKPHKVRLIDHGVLFESEGLALALSSETSLALDTRSTKELENAGIRTPGQGVSRRFTVKEGDSATFVLHEATAGKGNRHGLSHDESHRLFHNTIDFWRDWVSQCTYTGRWREMVLRSALALKLLTFHESGAIIAAATCGLPEHIGGERNWDYRYTWIRDAAFTLYSLLRIGFSEEARQFMGWIEARAHEMDPDGSLQIMYGVDGAHELTEQTLDHLSGYRESRPVRIGNAAYIQTQLDIYGALMDAVFLYNKYATHISYDLWLDLRRLVNWVCDHWKEKDAGIWEFRGSREEFTYSKLMCWVALDRAIRLSEQLAYPADRARWYAVRDEIYEEVMEKGYNEKRGAFVQYFGSDSLDASTLVMPLVFFVSPTDRRMVSTLDEILKTPREGGLVSNSLAYRYNLQKSPDGFSSAEGTFNICSFWLVDAMTREGMTNPERLDHARLIFEQMLGYANHLGLFAEETGPTGEALGNFPQAFTHLALISAAYNLDRALNNRKQRS
ncbi:MAG TPA: glycoside hydrolase family 15 protein [Spirochaetia bacterium]|nr:glycoside hydrolase family 15 protein [Spirochaetia bacterium]